DHLAKDHLASAAPAMIEIKNGRLPNGEWDSTYTPWLLIEVALEANGSRFNAATSDGGVSDSEAIQRAIAASISPLSSLTEVKLLTAAGCAILFATAPCGELLKLRPLWLESINRISRSLPPSARKSPMITAAPRRSSLDLMISRPLYFSRASAAPRAVKTRSTSVVKKDSLR